MAPPWTGAWQWLSDEYDGRLILTENYFCYAYAQKGRQRPQVEQPTEAEAAALFRAFRAEAGTVTGTQEGDEWLIDLVSTVAHHPANVGRKLRRAVRVEGDRMLREIVGIDGTRTATHERRKLTDPGSTPLAGAWQVESDDFDGLLLKTDSEYGYISTETGRPQITAVGSELSDADAAVLYHALHTQAGSYTVTGSTTVRTPTVSTNPAAHGREASVGFKVVGDTLTLSTPQVSLDWRKLE